MDILTEILDIQPEYGPVIPDRKPFWDVRVTYRPLPYSAESVCRVSLFSRWEMPPAVVLSEHPENRGMSVTNAAEYLVTAIFNHPLFRDMLGVDADRFPGMYLWIEHYPERGKVPEWRMVYFNWICCENGLWRAEDPRWYPLDLLEILSATRIPQPSLRPEDFF
jgi:hypothetical protein